MRGRAVLFVALAVVTALVAAYLGWSTSTPRAAGQPSAGPSRAATHRKASGSAPAGRPASAPSKGSATKASAPQQSASKASTARPKPPAPKPSTPKGCLTADATPAAFDTPSDEEPATEPASQPLADDGQVHFGPGMEEGRHGSVDTSIAPDRQALTTTYDDLEVEVGNGKVTDCDATRSYAMTIPLVGSGHRSVLRFHVQGYAYVEKGVTARLTVRGNGRTTTRDFPAGTNDTYLQTMELPATPGTSYRLETVIELHQDPAIYGATAILNANSVDVAIA
jgi:hypothetical protein